MNKLSMSKVKRAGGRWGVRVGGHGDRKDRWHQTVRKLGGLGKRNMK